MNIKMILVALQCARADASDNWDNSFSKRISEKTRIYRKTWIVGPIDAVIREIEKEQTRRNRNV